ncbi:MAG: hypothetical protein ACKO90_43920 [Microcystis panniformis]
MAYRCTRINEFTANTSIADRQGYYLKANSVKEAIELMARRFPGEQVTGEIWQ